MTKKIPKTAVGFVTYGESTAKYLPYFLASLEKQTLFSQLEFLVYDNSFEKDTSNRDYINRNYPLWSVMGSGRNLGFAAAYNVLFRKAMEKGSEYFLALNPDLILEPDAIEFLVQGIKRDPTLGSVSPKILKWDFERNKKTDIIDTCGIELKKGLRFTDLGQGEKDEGQYDNKGILGPSGAAALYDLSALKRVEVSGQYFDEMMFMYKEDCDLAYRLYLEGFGSICVGSSVFYHDRTASGKKGGDLKAALNRKSKSKQVKKWSFLNQQIIFLKYWKIQDFSSKLSIIWFQFRILFFVLFFETYLIKEWLKLPRLSKGIKRYHL